MATAKEKIKTNQVKKAREIEKRLTEDKMSQYKRDLKDWQDRPENRIINPDGSAGVMRRGPQKPASLIGRYESSLKFIEEYSNMSKEERDKIARKEKDFRVEQSYLDQAKNYVSYIAKQTSHKSLNRNTRSLMKNEKIREE
tara:strand:- start:1273 stop:1695 length:423 start_codon:yes stop_codon:yes gene_type:complete